jgi:hypothetical protein
MMERRQRGGRRSPVRWRDTEARARSKTFEREDDARRYLSAAEMAALAEVIAPGFRFGELAASGRSGWTCCAAVSWSPRRSSTSTAS